MKIKLLCLSFVGAAFSLHAQNVGIGTTTPAASLDVRGSQRVGGLNNYVKFDSATGKIEWTGASLFVPTYQQIIKHSSSSEGLYSGAGKLEYRNTTSPVFFSDWTSGNGYFSGDLGIGTTTPTAKLYVKDGSSGITPFFSSSMVVETNTHTYINLLSPDPFETGILFGSGTQPASGVIAYNTSTVPKGFVFSDNGNQTRMVINSAGNVGIGNTNPNAPLAFPPALGKKITLYPGTTGDVGFGVSGNRLQIYSDNPNADVAIGYDAAGTFNERFAVKPNGALSLYGNTGSAGQLIQSNGAGSAANWITPSKYFYFDQTTNINNLGNNFTTIDGINGQPFTVTVVSDLIISFDGIVTNGSTTNIDQSPNILVIVYYGGTEVGRANAYTFLKWSSVYGVGTTLATQFHIRNAVPGPYSLECKVQKFDASGTAGLVKSQVRVQVVPQ